MSNLDKKVNKILKEINKDADLKNELQTEIDPSIRFRRNSVNILIGKRGSGKTYNTFRELLKLQFIKNHNYSKILYVSDKSGDSTFDRLTKELLIPVETITYDDIKDEIIEISNAKAAIQEMKDKGISTEDLEEDAKENIENLLGDSIDDMKSAYHTAIILDDAMNLFATKTTENKNLIKKFFENRQANITYFIILQDAKGIDTSMKENADSIWVFGGYSKQKFSYIIRNIPTDETRDELYEKYKNLTRNQAIIFNNFIEGNSVILLNEK